MATTIPPVHNYESQIVFSNQSNNIKSTDVIAKLSLAMAERKFYPTINGYYNSSCA